MSKRSLLIVIALLSFGLRVWGLAFGLPFAYHPDEQQYIWPAIGVVSGDFRPLAHYNPALFPYVIGLVYTFNYWLLRLLGAFPAFFDLNLAWSEPMQPWTAGLIYLARYTSAAAGVLTVLMVYRLGRRAYSRTTGLGAALIFGLAFLPVREAHFAVSDAPVALGVAVALYVCLRIVERGRWPAYLKTGLALGLAAATKYSAGLLVLPVGTAHLLSRRYRRWSQRIGYGWLLLLTGLVSGLAYLAVSPYTLIEKEAFWADFSENLGAAKSGFQGLNLDPGGGAIFYLKGLGWGLGWPLTVLFILTVIFMIWRHSRTDLVLLVLPVLGFFYMQRQEMYFVRWLMPFLPPMAVLAAETVRAGTERFTKKAALPLVLALLFVLPSFYMAVWADQLFSRPDTRTEALHWIGQNIPSGSVLAVRVLSPPWGPPLNLPGLPVGPYRFVPVPDGGVAEIGWEQYQTWQTQYVIASSFYYARPLRDQARQAQLAANLERLETETTLLAEFNPYRPGCRGFFYHDQVYGPANDTLCRTQPGPIIKIYRLP